MKLDEIVAWYQKKIGTYDKQQWEKTVEQKILDGFNSVTLKNAKLKTDLIDVDLVRGSTFPKAKPKQSLVTVIRLAILRYFFLPVYAQWWVRQTSPNTFALLLLLYISQMITWAVYTFNIHRQDNSVAPQISSNNESATTTTNNLNDSNATRNEEEHIVMLSDLIIPMGLGLLLSFIHSQIVATNTASGAKSKRRRFSNASQNGKPTREPRVRRRKKLVRVRSQELMDASAQQQQQQTSQQQSSTQLPSHKLSAIKKLHASLEKLTKNTTITATESMQNMSSSFESNDHLTPKKSSLAPSARLVSHIAQTLNSNTTATSETHKSLNTPAYAVDKLKLDLNQSSMPIKSSSSMEIAICSNSSCFTDSHSSRSNINNNNKKRNVNWHSPVHNYASGSEITTQEKQQQTSPQSLSSPSPSASASASAATTTTTSETNSPNNCMHGSLGPSNGSTTGDSSSSQTGSPNKTVRIDECVQEFYDDLLNRTDQGSWVQDAGETTATNVGTAGNETGINDSDNHLHLNHTHRRHVGDDDGFESLNGKSSSGEEMNVNMPVTYIPPALTEEGKLRLRLNAPNRGGQGEYTSTNEVELKSNIYYRLRMPLDKNRPSSVCDAYPTTRKLPSPAAEMSSDTDEEGDDGETVSSPASLPNYNECTTSATEWLGITTNSDECSYSSELENSDDFKKPHNISDEDDFEVDYTPTTILNPHGTSDRISCTVWEKHEIKKAQMSVLEISSCIIERVESMPETNDYIYIGLCFTVFLSLIPSFCRLCEATIENSNASEISYLEMPSLLWEKASFSFCTIFRFAFGKTQWERTVLVMSFLQRLCLTMIVFIIFAVAERTFKQRFLYAKLFSHLTSSRRARKSNLPHFRLNKVRNIKTWLSVRSYLKKRGPQRSVDVIISAAFIVTLLLLAFLSVEWLKDSVQLHSHLNLEALMWSSTIGIFLLRFMTLGNKIHHKYRSISVLITEQINLYLQIEQKPKKKEELMVANSVLKLAADLLKELETPFKISGLSANPYLFTTVKVVILSALSGVLSEMLGFKLKLHKIKIK